LGIKGKKMIELNEDNFNIEVIESKIPVLVDIYAPWCKPCTNFLPIIIKIAEEFKDKIKASKINIDENEAIVSQYNVMAVPTLLFFKQGKLIEKLIGTQKESTIREVILNLIK
jgi:thioredoxin 1